MLLCVEVIAVKEKFGRDFRPVCLSTTDNNIGPTGVRFMKVPSSKRQTCCIDRFSKQL